MTESAELPPASAANARMAASSVTRVDIVPPPLETGSRVGSFELRKVIAQGPSTAVYTAHDTTLGVDVVIKEFRLAREAAQQAFTHPSTNSSTGSRTHVQLEPTVERGLRAFVEEARMLARCANPSLLAVRGLFESRGTAYRVMPAYTLTGLIELRASMPRPPDEPSVRAVINHLLGALEALHANGHVHGSVTGNNVLLLPDDRPLLMGPGSAAREAAHVQAVFDATHHPGNTTPLFTDQVSAELRDLADLAEFCITGVQRPAGHIRAAADTVTASIVRELGAVELRHYSRAFLSVLDVASSARSDDRPRNTAQFVDWLGSHQARRLKHPPRPLPELQARQAEWVNTVPPAMWAESAAEAIAPSAAERGHVEPQDSVSTSQIWADTVQVFDDNPLPAKSTAVYPLPPQPQPQPQPLSHSTAFARPNFEQHHWQARKWAVGLGVLGVGLTAALIFVVGGPQNAALPNVAIAASNAGPNVTTAGAAPAAANLSTAVPAPASPSQPAVRAAMEPDKPTRTTVGAAALSDEMPEIQLPVAAPFSAASSVSVTNSASPPSSTAAAIATLAAAAAAPAVLAARPRAETPAAKPKPKAPVVASKPPKGVKISNAAWANGPRAVCSVRAGTAAISCLKTQCLSRKWALHPQCARYVGSKSSG